MAFSLQKVGWNNGSSPAINDTNLKQMENNSEKGINDLLNFISSNIIRYLSANWEYYHTGSEQYLQEPVKLDKVINNGNGYLEAGDNYSVIIKSGVHHIDVKGIISISHTINEHAGIFLYIRKNGNIISKTNEDADYKNTTNSISIFADYMEVTEGDKIQLYFACDNERGTINGNNSEINAQMSVRVVD